MARLSFPGVKLNDVLLRLGDREQQVCALASDTADGWQSVLAWNGRNFSIDTGNAKQAIKHLDKLIKEQRAAGRLVIGYLSYDLGCGLQDVNLQAADDLKMPLLLVRSFDSWLSFDENGAIGETHLPLFVDEVHEILERPVRQLPPKIYDRPLMPVQSREWYSNAYQKVQAHIRAGDVYQLNLTHRLEGCAKLSGPELFASLSAGSQAGFQAYIEGDDFEIISLSPERFIRVKGDSITTSPVKGTRPRGHNAEDEMLRQDLLNSPKDRAELDMITDLMRNDLGKICQAGSVKVAERRSLTAYPTLWHAHSTISGRLETGITPIAALASVLPGGSITGCPKKRAIEIIDGLEPIRRGIYTGSIFTVRPDGELDSNIAIRTMIKKGSKLYLSVGGGLVYDSDEAAEYRESLDKAAAFGGKDI
jgi:para-aminobenzoate synthetase component 1